MAFLNENSQRKLALLIFFLFGPFLLMFIGVKLFTRSTDASVQREEQRLSSILGYNLSISKKEYLRPGAQRLSNVSASSKSVHEQIFFCPEIYFITESDPNFVRNIAISIDSFSMREKFSSDISITQNEHYISNVQVGAPSLFNNIITDAPKNSLETLLFDSQINNEDASKKFEKYLLIVIPRFLCKQSQILDLKSEIITLVKNLPEVIGTRSGSKQLCCLAIGKIEIQTDEEFDVSVQEVKTTFPIRKNNLELASFFKDKKTLHLDKENSSSPKVIEKKIRAFESESPTIENCKALFIKEGANKRVDTIFELRKVSEATPYYLSFEYFNKNNTFQFEFNSQNTPIPSSFITLLFPYFKKFGASSWFSGQLRLETFSSETAFITANNSDKITASSNNYQLTPEQSTKTTLPFWIAKLYQVRLCNSNLNSLSNQLGLPQLTGTITDLVIDSGLIKQGVLEGAGKIYVKEGSIPVAVLVKLEKNGFIEVIPQKIMNYRFPNEAIPFDELSLSFEITPSGMILDSSYRNKIVACYEHGKVKYGLFLQENSLGGIISYSKLLQTFIDYENDEFWSPLIKNAINHLPVSVNVKKKFNTEEEPLKEK